MKKEEFKRMEDCLYEECLRFLDEFSKTPDNEDVYAFVLDCDDVHGNVIAVMETEREFLKKLSDYPRYAHLYNFLGGGIDGPEGYKYSEGDFTYRDDLFGNQELNALLMNYYSEMIEQEISEEEREYNYQQFHQVMVKVINRLQPFAQLNKTDKFIAYYVLHDIDVETKVSLMKKTIPMEQLKKVFPSYNF